jgi:hypothetical protein
MVRIHLAALVMAVSACAMAPPSTEDVGAAEEALTGCRAACFVFDRLKCGAVEYQCGKTKGIVVLDGVPYDCIAVELVACRLGEHPLSDCLDQCGDADAPPNTSAGLSENPRPDPVFSQGGGEDPSWASDSGDSGDGDYP